MSNTLKKIFTGSYYEITENISIFIERNKPEYSDNMEVIVEILTDEK